METQTHSTNPTARIEAARQIALGTLSRARETLQQAATTVPVWAREVETRAEVQVDALLERVGLMRIARADALRAPAPNEVAAPAPVDVVAEVSAVAAPVPLVEAAPLATEADEPVDAETPDAVIPEAHDAADRPSRRRRR